MKYVVLEIKKVKEGSLAKTSDKVVVAEDLIDSFVNETLIDEYNVNSSFEGKELVGTVLKHPLFEKGYDFDVPLLEADFVTTEQGTGFVHIAPGHGANDFELGRKHSLETLETVNSNHKSNVIIKIR